MGMMNAAEVGWSFVPSTNLLVTWVGFEDCNLDRDWASDKRVTFWSSTNTPMAVYSSASLTAPVEIDTNSVAYGMVYGKISPFPILAAEKYYVTVNLRSNVPVVEGFDSSGSDCRPFQVAPELSYLGVYWYDARIGALTPSSPSTNGLPPTTGLLLGPAFSFLVAAEAVPQLSIESVAGRALLSWPTNAPDCVVEMSTVLPGNVWQPVTSAPVVMGQRYVLPYDPGGSQPRFFRLRLW
jgi:hypothetical protein